MPSPDASRLVTRAFLAEGVTKFGDAVTIVALPVAAVLVLGASAGELALIGAAQALPVLLLSLPLGAWVDRRRRRWPYLVAADLARAALLVVVPVAAVLGGLSIPLLVVIAFASSAFGTLFDLAQAGWLARVLRGDDLHRANARVELARSAGAIGGPAVGGGLVAILSAPFTLLVDAISFLASAALFASVRRAEPVITPPADAAGRPGLAAGFRHLRREPFIAAVAATAGINNLSRSIALGVVVLYLVEVGGLSAAEIGAGFAIGNAGFLAGSLLSRRLSRRLGMGPTMQAGIALFGPSMLAFAVAPPALAGLAFTVMLFANGFGIAVHNVNQVTVRQILTPDHLRARVAAVFRLLVFGAIPVGTTIGGVVAELAGLRAALMLSGIGLCLGSAPYVLVRIRRLQVVEQLIPATP